jgi:hypothetical protein
MRRFLHPIMPPGRVIQQLDEGTSYGHWRIGEAQPGGIIRWNAPGRGIQAPVTSGNDYYVIYRYGVGAEVTGCEAVQCGRAGWEDS